MTYKYSLGNSITLSMLTLADKPRSKTKLFNMSVKVKDVLNVYRKNKLDRTLGLIDHPKQYRFIIICFCKFPQ